MLPKIHEIKALLPWWLKIFAKIILSRFPVKYGFWSKAGLFRHGYMDSCEYSLGVFVSHVKRADLEGRLEGKTILELGPGDSVATALIAKAHGAKSILVDAGSYAVKDLPVYKAFADFLTRRGYSLPSLEGIGSFDEFLQVCGSSYLTNSLASLCEIADESVDFVFSQAVLEHVRRHEFIEIQRHLARILSAEGVCSHRVDLRDHLGGALNNLRFKEGLWESDFFARSGFYTNRIQMKLMLELFDAAEFVSDMIDVRRWDSLPTPRSKMDPAFAALSDDELDVAGFDVLLRHSSSVARIGARSTC